jgi:opacity protein-like surface antigen
MNKILITLFTFLTVATSQTQAQEQTITIKLPHQLKKYTIATHPFYGLNSGVRFDFEMRIKNTPSWIQIGTAGYLVPRRDEEKYNQWVTITGDELNSLLGGGLELNYKYFFNNSESLYVAGGCSYSRYNIEYIDKYWDSYIEHGLEYRMSKFGILNQKIDKFGINTYFGYQIPKPTFLFDMFVGLGYRYSLRSNIVANPFDNGMISFGYKGVVFITGVRFGVKFKQ